jgi:hypothetical protein
MCLSRLRWNTANTSFMIVCIQLLGRLLMMHNHKSLTRHVLSCSGWGKKHVCLGFSYKGGQLIQKGQWCAKANILRLTVVYLNALRNRKTRNTEVEIATNGSTQTWHDLPVDGYGPMFGPPRHCRSEFWTVLEQN